MMILSLAESEKIAQEADFLCEVITSHAQSLREARLGRRVCFNGVSFKLFQKGRNVIYRIQTDEACTKEEGVFKGDRGPYAITALKRFSRRVSPRKSANRWFLKMSRSGNPKIIRREALGAETVAGALRSHPCYYHASAVRASLADTYMLYSEVPGKPLLFEFYKACFSPIPGEILKKRTIASTLLSDTFSCFGDVIARLHAFRVQEKENSTKSVSKISDFDGEQRAVHAKRVLPATGYKHPAYSLRKLIDKVKAPDVTCRSILLWFNKHGELSDEPVFVHGNLRLDNVLVSDGKICLIDFENCGQGSLYADLSRACSMILLTRTLPLFPWNRARVALNSFLQAYKAVSGYDRKILLQYITMRLCAYYVKTYCLKRMKTTIAGLPVSKSRFQRLVIAMLEGNIDPMLAGVGF